MSWNDTRCGIFSPSIIQSLWRSKEYNTLSLMDHTRCCKHRIVSANMVVEQTSNNAFNYIVQFTDTCDFFQQNRPTESMTNTMYSKSCCRHRECWLLTKTDVVVHTISTKLNANWYMQVSMCQRPDQIGNIINMTFFQVMHLLCL